jgi:regulator of telomere elongation helicase 1
MNSKKPIFLEGESEHILTDFRNQIKEDGKKGALLLGVFRGKFAEGIDYPNDLCRAVFLVGIPNSPIKDIYIIEKKKYLNAESKHPTKKTLTGSEWY